MEIVQDKFADGLRYLHQSQYSGEGSRGCQDEQDWCKSTDRFYKDRPDITELNALVYEQTDDQGLKSGDNSSFCRRSNTCVDTSENDDRA